MAGNSIGTIFKLTTFGESHGEALGGIIDGCPAGIELDFKLQRGKVHVVARLPEPRALLGRAGPLELRAAAVLRQRLHGGHLLAHAPPSPRARSGRR